MKKPAVAVLVFNRRGHLLLGFNAARQGWECPGGKVEDGEPTATAMRRECREECGIQINGPAHFIAMLEEDEYVTALFRCTTIQEPMVTKDGAHSEWRWFPVYDLPKMTWPESGRYAIEEVASGVVPEK